MPGNHRGATLNGEGPGDLTAEPVDIARALQAGSRLDKLRKAGTIAALVASTFLRDLLRCEPPCSSIDSMGQATRPDWLTLTTPRLAIAGVAMPFLFLGFSTILGLTRAGYDLVRDPISRLGEQGAANSLVWQLGGFFAAAALELGYAGALWAVFRRSLVAALMVAIAALLAVSSAAPLGSTLTQVHMIAGILLFACLALIPLAAWREFRRRPEWADMSRGSMVVGVLLVAWFLLEPNFEAYRLGFWQRASLVVALGWQAVVALRVRRLALRRLEVAPAT
jgi:Protein of unknown function (DUF998)